MLDTRIRKHEKTSPDDENYNYLCFYNDDALEASKRINAYDDLLTAINTLLCEIESCDTYSVADSDVIDNARELLDRLK